MKTFIKENIVVITAIFIFAIALTILIILNNKQKQNDITNAVSQHEVERLISEKEYLQQQIIGYKAIDDSLWSIVRQQNTQLSTYKKKYADMALKYDTERNKIKELNAVEQVEVFLDKTEQGEFPIISYEDTTQYIIPINSIQYANIAFVDLEEQINVNALLRGESNIKTMQIKDLNLIIDNKDLQIEKLFQINDKSELIIEEKDKQIKATESKYKKEVAKKYFVGAIGGVALILSFVF
jgi:hypothetical protein